MDGFGLKIQAVWFDLDSSTYCLGWFRLVGVLDWAWFGLQTIPRLLVPKFVWSLLGGMHYY